MNRIKLKTVKLKAKRSFFKKGTCSRTFFYLLNREFGYPMDDEERATDFLAGGILQQGYQCGMLWGASLAIGAESLRRNNSIDQAISVSITATQYIMESFTSIAKSVDCEDITSCDVSNKSGLAKFFFTGKFMYCYKLAGKWAPKAIKAANEGLSHQQTNMIERPLSCATEVVRKMGASNEEMVMVAGFAGGLGLSGDGCGALAAALWMNTLIWNRRQSGKSFTNNPNTEKILNAFYKETDYEMECDKICEQKHRTLGDHTVYIKKGGCNKLINVLTDISSLQ